MNQISIELLKELDNKDYTCLIAKFQTGIKEPIFFPYKENPEELIPLLSVRPFEEDEMIIIKDAIAYLTDEQLTGKCITDDAF